ncbi:MAG: dihydroorotate dehydrogenase electron transfer subunit [Eubacteriales bacterium]|nr:dihydroorotate dehydrogenase electron transfer subunit [Eubacteriales bacterium]
MAEIIKNEPIANGIYRMSVFGAPLGRAGQFFMLRVPGALDPLLGRPISICEIDADKGETTFVYQPIGRGTAQFAALLPGQQIEAQGPYGNGFPLKGGRTVLIGGGIGTAPMLQLAKELRKSDPARKIDVFLGFREEAYLEKEFESYADNVTRNIGGYVTNDVDFALDATYYACGPSVMLRAAAKAADEANASLFVSLEKHMACGVGACLGCTCQTEHGRKRVCKDGPVFDYREVRDAI